MANFCNFNIRLKAPSKSCAYAIYWSQLRADDMDIYLDEERDDGYYLFFTGACKWSLDAYVTEDKKLKIDLDELPDEDDCEDEDNYDSDLFEKLCKIPLSQKSKLLKTDIDALSWDDEYESCYLSIIRNGKEKQKIENPDSDESECEWEIE